MSQVLAMCSALDAVDAALSRPARRRLARRRLAPCYTDAEDVSVEIDHLEISVPELDGVVMFAELLVRGTVQPDTPDDRDCPGVRGAVEITSYEVTNLSMHVVADAGNTIEVCEKVLSVLWRHAEQEIADAALHKAGDVERRLWEVARGY